ncbi:MAG TPA: IS110 family transposase [Leucothrix sp.]|nr:IS110 family transposase [Leucothrix sp.]
MNINVIGLDLAKIIFHLIGLDQHGKQVLKKKLRRAQMLAYFANLTPCTIAMEACGTSHYWARELQKLGHHVKLLPAQHVKPFVRGNKNDYNDALGIAEASRIPQMREVSVKTVEQQSIQALQRFRRSAVGDRTALCNQVRGLLAEFGISLNQGVATLRKAIPEILEDAENGLHAIFRDALSLKYQQLCQLDDLIDDLTRAIQKEAKLHHEIKLLQSIPGYGPILSSAFYCVFGDGKGFRKGRDASAAIGVVPRQHSTGGKNVLLGISKKGDKYLRSLMVHGARSLIKHAHKKEDALSCWVTALIERRGKNKATVALANKLTRIGWAVITTGKPYEENYAV